MAFPFSAPTLGTLATVLNGNLTLTEPSGSASGDLLVATIAARGNAAFTLPAGWTICGTQQLSGNTTFGGTGSIASGLMCYIIRGASAPALTWSRTAGDLGFGRILRYPGPFAASPLDAASANTLGAASATITTAGLSASYDSTLLVGMVAGARAGTVSGFTAASDPAQPSGATNTTSIPDLVWTERADSNTTSGAGGTISVFDAVKQSPGATGAFSSTHSTSAQHVMIVAAFEGAGVDLTEERVSRITGYALVDTMVKNAEVSRIDGYAVLALPVTEVRVSRIDGYAVLKPGIGVPARKRRIQNVNYY